MTISITTNKTGPTAGDGVVTSFNYHFRIDDEDDLVVIHTDAAGVEATLTITTDYTVAGVGTEAGGTITYPVSGTPLPATETLTLKRVLSLTQLTNLRNQGGYFPEVQETALDRLLMQIQQLDEADGRAITLSPTTDTGAFSPVLPGTLTANFVLAVNSSGTGLALVKATPSGVVISVFAATFLDDTTAAAARTTLEIDGSSGKIVAGDLATDTVETAKIKALAVTTAKLAAAVNPLGKHAIPVNAGEMVATVTAGATAGLVELPTNDVMLATFDFDAAADEKVQFQLKMPKRWNEGTVTARVGWSHTGGANFGVAWAIRAVAVGNDDAQDAAFGTAVVTTDTGGTNNDHYVTAESAAITIAGTPAVDDLVLFEIFRDVSDAGDDLTVDARLEWCVIFMTTDAATDD